MRLFLQCDLKQAESRFVAYDSADSNLIQCLEDPKRDIHSEVAAEIFSVPVEQVRAEHKSGRSEKRQLGKKSGHGANYSMGVQTFVESCLKELDLVITDEFGRRVLEAYHTLFPGIRLWHEEIRQQVRTFRKLENPFGRVRFFYGRMEDKTYREAYAYRPQSTVPDITNFLILKLARMRELGDLDFHFHLQCHDSVTVSCANEGEVLKVGKVCRDLDLWHPRVKLKAGELRIPTDVEFGDGLGNLKPLT